MKLSQLFPFNWIGDLIRFSVRMAVLGRENVRRSIRLQLIFLFAVCLAASFCVYGISNVFFGEINRAPVLDYRQGVEDIDRTARSIANMARSGEQSMRDIQEYIEQTTRHNKYKALLVDLDGKVIFKTANATENQVDIHNLIGSAMENRTGAIAERQEVTSFYPMDIQGSKMYLVVTGIPQPTISYRRGSSPLSVLFTVSSFVLLFYWLTKRKMADIEKLAGGLQEISKGNLDYRIVQQSHDELGSLAGNINRMAEALQKTLEEERRAERTKNELITNVSHDLRTPLTLIMGYLRLLKDKNYENGQQADAYISIAYNKSEKLKGLIDDLFEYTKLSNHGVPLQRERVCLNELLEQLMEELVTMAEENELQFARNFPQERIMLTLDAHKMIRVFENLFTNAIKYSHRPGTIKVRMVREPGSVVVCIANYGDPIPREELPRLFERFYRADPSRTSSSGGSGLGLAIAKSIVESHDGDIWAEAEEGEIRFCVRLPCI